MLAELRAHYPEHQQQREGRRRREKEERRQATRTTHPSHHHHSNPAHKPSPPFNNDTTLPYKTHTPQTNNAVTANTKTEENSGTQPHNEIPHRYSTHLQRNITRHNTTRQDGKRAPHPTALPYLQHTTREEAKQCKGNGTIRGRGRQHEDGEQHNIHHHRHSIGPPCKHKGDTNTQTAGVGITAPALPSPCHPTTLCHPLHPQCPHPPPRTGEGGRRIPHRTNTTDTHTTHTSHTRQRTVHDTTAVLTSTALGWVGHGPHHWTVRVNSSTHHRHSTAVHTEKDGHHPLTSFTHQRSMMINEHDDQRTMIVVR